MTGISEIIPADRWPEWAATHSWDENGEGWFYGQCASRGVWESHAIESHIPMPAGWDWRVPVMRHQPSPAIDLEQFRAALIALSDYAYERHGSMDHPHCVEADRLLALIDSQTGKGE